MAEKIRTNKQGLINLLIVTLVFGSLWGFSEVVLGGSLRTTDFPYRSGLLTAIGMALMGMAFVFTRKPLTLVGVGIVAALVTQLSVPILHNSIMCKANSSLALVIEAASLGLVAAIMMRKTNGNVYARMGGGASAALLASAAFYVIGTRVAPCPYLLSFATPAYFIVKEGLVWAGFTALLFPLGYLAGEKLAAMSSQRSYSYYAATLGVTGLSWGVSALAIAAGF